MLFTLFHPGRVVCVCVFFFITFWKENRIPPSPDCGVIANEWVNYFRHTLCASSARTFLYLSFFLLRMLRSHELLGVLPLTGVNVYPQKGCINMRTQGKHLPGGGEIGASKGGGEREIYYMALTRANKFCDQLLEKLRSGGFHSKCAGTYAHTHAHTRCLGDILADRSFPQQWPHYGYVCLSVCACV